MLEFYIMKNKTLDKSVQSQLIWESEEGKQDTKNFDKISHIVNLQRNKKNVRRPILQRETKLNLKGLSRED